MIRLIELDIYFIQININSIQENSYLNQTNKFELNK